ncbi:MAG TPA: PAS domain-containing protein [Telluria sp.]|nr:PAS domain-containing protein [Telluria sp.]
MSHTPFHQETLMNRRRRESSSLAVAAVLLIAAGGAGVLLAARQPLWPSSSLAAVLALSAGWAVTLLWLGRVCAQRDQAASASAQLHAHEAAQRADAQRALAASELKLSEIISTMPVALFLKDPDSRVLLMNKAAEQQFGFDFAAVSGTKGHALFPPDQMAVFLANDRAAFTQGQLVIQEDLAYSHVRNEDRQLQTFKKPIFDAVTGDPDFLICMSVDVTERKRAEQALHESYLQLRQLIAHLEATKDEEHRRLASEIHDELGQNLLALKIDIEMLHARAGERHPHLRRKVGHALGTLDASIRAVRAIINELHPGTLELGLAAALEWLVGQFETHSGIATSISVSGTEQGTQDPRRTAALFRIVQEALLDILRHAEAMQVELTVVFTPEHLSITILDDGIAATEREPGQRYGFGLRGIRERVEVFGGRMLVERRSANAGTCVSIVVPVAAGTIELASVSPL